MTRWLLTRQRLIVAGRLAARGDARTLWQRARLSRRESLHGRRPSADRWPARPAASAHRIPGRAAPAVLLTLPFLVCGGAERMLSRVVGHLASSGRRVIVVTTRSTPFGYSDGRALFEDAAVALLELPSLLPERQWLNFLDRLIAEEHVGVLWQAGSDYVYHALTELRRRHPELRVIASLFNTEVHVDRHLTLVDQIDLTIVESEVARKTLIGAGMDPARLVRVPNGVDTAYFHGPERDRPRPVAQVGFAGRLAAEKDPLAFVELASACRDLPMSFHLAGDGPLAGAVARRVRRRGLRQTLVLHGFLGDVRELLTRLDVLVVPSHADGRPNVVLEAMAMGVPVLASPVGALPELVTDGVNGFLCTSVSDFAGRLRWLCAHPESWLQMSRAARSAAVCQFDAAGSYQRYELLFDELLHEPWARVGHV